MDFKQYMGVPFKDHGRSKEGVDCWGLVWLIYKEQLGITLPDFGCCYQNADVRSDIQCAMNKYTLEQWNRDVTKLPKQVGDVLVFKRGGIETHIGLWISEGTMIHIQRPQGVSIERYDTIRWKNKFSRALRHISL